MTITLTQAGLEKYISQMTGLPKRDSKEIVRLFFECIRESLIAGRPVKLSGFGNFVLHDKKARPGRNPRNGQEVVISARRVVTFHCGQKLKMQVEKNMNKTLLEQGIEKEEKDQL